MGSYFNFGFCLFPTASLNRIIIDKRLEFFLILLTV